MKKSSDKTRPLYVEVPVPICTYDIDMHAHVNNIVYIRWLEGLRYEVLKAYYPPERLVAQGLMPVLHSTQITYRKALRLFDEPTGHMWCTALGRATLTLEAEFRLNCEVYAHAVQRLMLVGIGGSKAARWPLELVEKFNAMSACNPGKESTL